MEVRKKKCINEICNHQEINKYIYKLYRASESQEIVRCLNSYKLGYKRLKEFLAFNLQILIPSNNLQFQLLFTIIIVIGSCTYK